MLAIKTGIPQGGIPVFDSSGGKYRAFFKKRLNFSAEFCKIRMYNMFPLQEQRKTKGEKFPVP